jgi:hypothetical protein
MTDRLITTMEKNSQEEILFSLQEYRGTHLIDIRVYYDSGSGEGNRPKRAFPFRLNGLMNSWNALKRLRNLSPKNRKP